MINIFFLRHQKLGPNESGEILAKTAGTMFSGYLGSEEDEAKYKDSFDGEGFFKTGDLVRIPAEMFQY